MGYAALICAVLFGAMLVSGRLLTNRVLSRGISRVPVWISAIYMIGLLGLVVTSVWAFISIAWWAGVIVLGIYGLTRLVPSALSSAANDPKIAHLAAIQQASQELAHLPPGEDKMQAVMTRADEIMRAKGWTPKPSR